MRVLNPEAIIYIGLRGGVTTTLNFSASPILGEAIEVDPGIAINRVEQQTWGIDLVNLGTLYPPQPGDSITRATGEKFMVAPCEGQESCFKHVRSTRDRLLVMTKRYHGAT